MQSKANRPTFTTGVVVTVVNEHSGAAIAGAMVKVGGVEQQSNERGRADYQLPTGKYRYVVSSEDQEETGLVDVRNEQLTKLTVKLPASAAQTAAASEPTSQPTATTTANTSRKTVVSQGVAITVVENATEKPIADANVLVGGSPFQCNSEGRVECVLPAGKYRYVVTAEGFEEETGLVDVVNNRLMEVTVRLASGAPKRSMPGVNASVRDHSTGKPIAMALLRVGGVSQLTDESGTADIDLRSAKFRYTVKAHGYQQAKGIVEVPTDGQANLDVRLDADAMSALSGLFVTVIDDATDGPVAQAKVQLAGFSELTDASGRAEFFLPPGSYEYDVKAEGCHNARGPVDVPKDDSIQISINLLTDDSPAPVSQDDDDDDDSDDDLNVGTDDTEDTATPSTDGAMGELFVEVVDRAVGDSIGSAKVTVGDRSGSTNDNGLVTFDLPQGSYPYTVNAPNFASASGTVQVTEDTDLTVELDAGSDAAPPQPAKGPMGELFVEVVHRASGDPIGGAEVKVGDQTSTSNDNGLVTFDLPRGPHAYEVNAPNYTSVSGMVEVTDDTDLTVEFDASGQESAASQPLAGPESPPPDGPMGELYVDVVDRGSGDPITSALFKIGSHAAETNDNGLVTFDLPQGTYSYEASAANYASASGTVEVTDDTDLTVELDPN